MAAVASGGTSRTLKLVGIALVAGSFSGLFGVGGGTAIVALLILWLDYSEKPATGTSLLAIVIIALVAAIAHGLFGSVDVEQGLLLGVPGVIGVVIGTSAQQRVADRTIAVMFTVLLFAIAAFFIAGGQ